MYRATITVRLRPSILDPEGKTIEHALHSLELSDLREVRVGKHIELTVHCESEQEATEQVRMACTKLLANPVMEDYTYTLEKTSG